MPVFEQTGKRLPYLAAYYGVMAAGMALRIFSFLHNPGLWLDEALLALNIIEKDFAGLLLPLDRNQVAPILFLFALKSVTLLAGTGEMALRLFPLLCSLAGLPLFYAVALKLLKDERPALLAFILFALSPLQIRYAIEVKQYMTDVFVFLFLIWLYLKSAENQFSPKSRIILLFSGLIAIFLSHIAILALFTISLHRLGSIIRERRRPAFSEILLPAAWASAFGLFHYFFVAGHKTKSMMLDYWMDHFLPLNPLAPEFFHFFNTTGRKVFFEFILFNQAGFSHTVNFILITLFLLVSVLGILVLTIQSNRKALYFLLLPVVLHLGLSAFRLYPFETRLALYLSPLIHLAAAYGIFSTAARLTRLTRARLTGYSVMIAFVSVMTWKTAANMPLSVDHARESIHFIADQYKPGQEVLIYEYSRPVYDYYTYREEFRFSGNVRTLPYSFLAPESLTSAEGRIKPGGECWYLFSHFLGREDEKWDPVRARFEDIGTILLEDNKGSSAAFLIRRNGKVNRVVE